MYRKEKRIPTLVALLIIFAGLGGVMFIDQQNTLQLQAKSAPKPQDVHISNVSDTSFTVNWHTEAITVGLIEVSGDGNHITLFDNDDADNVKRPRTAHVVTVKNLKEITQYSIKVKGSGTCRNDSECPTFTQKTGNKLGVPAQMPPLRGTIATADGKPITGAIVYANIGKSALVSGRTDSLGLWVIPLSQLRTQDLTSYYSAQDGDTAQITASQSPTSVATAIIDIGSIKQGVTLPPMVIGNSYNFTNLQSKAALIANLPGRQVGLPGSAVLGTSQNPTIEVLFPTTQHNLTPDTQPRFFGVGIPNGKLTLTLSPSNQTATITVKQDRSWEWRPPRKLIPGAHFIIVSGLSSAGKRVNVNRKFTVLKSGERVLGEATESATLTPSPTITVPATPSATIIPTATLIPTIIPTSTPTVIPTAVPTIYPSATPATEPPRTGTQGPLIALLGTGVMLFGLGVKLLLSF